MWIAIVALILVCLSVAGMRTVALKAPAKVAYDPQITPEEVKTAEEKLGAMVRIPTVSKHEHEDLSDFYRYHAELEKQFPLLHKHLKKTVLGGTLLYLWKGSDPTLLPILFMGHQDVVPASDEGWSVPAYSGAVKDGCLYGRGTLDCKGTMYVQMQAVEELLAEGFVPFGDVYLEYSINEETGGDGAAAAMRYLKDKGIRLALVMDEGGAVIEQAIPGMDRPYAVLGITEKGYMDVKITAKGKGGHSSTPPRKTPAARLYAFANEIERKRPFKKKLIPEAKKMFRQMAPAMPLGMRFLMGNLWLTKPLVMAVMPLVSPFGEALMATTCCFTQMKGSDAANVIPKEPYLIANLRTSVHQNCEESLKVLKKYGKKYGLEFEDARDMAYETVAIPGTSEHHLGLAVDLLGDAAVDWLTKHCWDYGFIVRYTEEKEWITGIVDEPWHFRYVGTRVSLDLKDTGLCLEEYLGAEAVNLEKAKALYGEELYQETVWEPPVSKEAEPSETQQN